MSNLHILVVADTSEAAEYLTDKLLPQAGYDVTLADDFEPPPACDVVLVDVSHLRGGPFSRLRAQRRMGCDAPAILYAPRLTGDMAAEVFPLDVRDFIHKPASDDELLAQLGDFVERVSAVQEEEQLRQQLAESRASLSRRLEEMNALSRIGRAITSIDNIQTILDRILEASLYLASGDAAAVYVYDDMQNSLVLQVQHNLPDAPPQPAPDSMEAQVMQSGKKQVSEYSISAPVIIGGTVIGVLSVHRVEGDPFDKADEVVVTSLADYAAIAIDKVERTTDAVMQIDDALNAARNVKLHADTLYSPIDGIESQVETLLAGGFDPLTEAQHSAVKRIQQATERLKEIIDFIREELSDFEPS